MKKTRKTCKPREASIHEQCRRWTNQFLEYKQKHGGRTAELTPAMESVSNMISDHVLTCGSCREDYRIKDEILLGSERTYDSRCTQEVQHIENIDQTAAY